MNNSNNVLQVLSGYTCDSGRAALLPIDNAVNASAGNSASRKELEAAFIQALAGQGSVEAREYACNKLARVGSPASVAPLCAAVAKGDRVGAAALSAVEVLPFEQVDIALIKMVNEASGLTRIGVINCLGTRRHPASTVALLPLVNEADAEVRAAAIAALGSIGSPEAAKALLELAAQGRNSDLVLGNALLVASEHLRKEGHAGLATEIGRVISRSGFPQQVKMNVLTQI